MNAVPGCDRPGIRDLDLLWRIPLLVSALLLLAAVALYWNSLEWRDARAKSALHAAATAASFSSRAVAHHHDLLGHSSTAWFEARFCTPTPSGLPSPSTTALNGVPSAFSFTSHNYSRPNASAPLDTCSAT